MRLPITASPRLLQLGIRPRDGILAGPSSYFLRSLPLCSRSITTDLRLPDRSRWVLASRQRPFHVLVSPLRRLQPAFSPSYRRYSTVTAHSQTGFQDVSTSSVRPTTIPRSLPNWLLGCSALVFGILVIGGLTRLTESGLSITEWQPLTGILPPITQAEWDIEWEKYRVSPEGVL